MYYRPSTKTHHWYPSTWSALRRLNTMFAWHGPHRNCAGRRFRACSQLINTIVWPVAKRLTSWMSMIARESFIKPIPTSSRAFVSTSGRRRSCGTVIKSCHLSLVIIICVAGHFEQEHSALTDFPRDKKKVDPWSDRHQSQGNRFVSLLTWGKVTRRPWLLKGR